MRADAPRAAVAASAARRWVLLGILVSTLALAYFYCLDRIAFSSAGFSPIFDLLLSVYDARSAWVVVGICLAAAAWRDHEAIATLAAALARHRAMILIGAVLALAFAGRLVYHSYALSMDGYAAVFQAKIFAMGRLAARFPPYLVNRLVVPGFNGVFLVASPLSGKAIESYWPGFALLLAPFQWLGAPWLCNPLLAGLALVLIHQIVLDVTGDRRAAGLGVLFALASGAFVANAISYYSMQAHLTANLAYAWLLAAATRRRALLAGLVGSIALVLHNPVPHALFAAPWILWLALDRHRRRLLVPLALGYLPLSLGIGVGWFALRGAIAAELPRAAASVGGAAAIFRWPNAVMLNMRIAALVKMWVWASPCLFLFAWIGWSRFRRDDRVRLLAMSSLATFAGYLVVVFDQGHGWGYRYFHSAWGAVPVLAGCAMAARSESEKRLVAFAGAAAILSVFVLVPFQLREIDGFIGRHIAQIPEARRPGNDVFFVRPSGGYYIADMIQNDPALRSKDLMMISYGPKRDAELVRRLWPQATKVDSGPFGEEWNLGPTDVRVTPPGADSPRFVFPSQPPTRSR